MRRRSRMDVIMDMLRKAQIETSKTKLMYRCNLNFNSFNRYFEELLDKGLLVEVRHNPSGTVLYKTSEKGKRLLRALVEVFRLLSK